MHYSQLLSLLSVFAVAVAIPASSPVVMGRGDTVKCSQDSTVECCNDKTTQTSNGSGGFLSGLASNLNLLNGAFKCIYCSLLLNVPLFGWKHKLTNPKGGQFKLPVTVPIIGGGLAGDLLPIQENCKQGNGDLFCCPNSAPRDVHNNVSAPELGKCGHYIWIRLANLRLNRVSSSSAASACPAPRLVLSLVRPSQHGLVHYSFIRPL